MHDLKIWPKYFEEVQSGKKNFEVRRNDRDFKEGDIVKLHEFIKETAKYTDRVLQFKIGYVLHIEDFFGVKSDYVAFSLLPVEKRES